MVWLPVSIAMIGKFLISMTFAIAYLYTAELFPTKVRNVAVGTASTFARIGSISAPYIVDLLVSMALEIMMEFFLGGKYLHCKKLGCFDLKLGGSRLAFELKKYMAHAEMMQQ